VGVHLRKRFTEGEVVETLERYLSGEIGIKESLLLLKLKRSQFFKILGIYRTEGKAILSGEKIKPSRKLSEETEQKILKELAEEKQLIDDKDNPIRFYNYSYVKSRLEEKYAVKVSLPSIIGRAKKTVIIKKGRPGNPTIEKC
jgi:hypothetical protein